MNPIKPAHTPPNQNPDVLTMDTLLPQTLLPQTVTPDRLPRTQLAPPARNTPATITQVHPPARPRRTRARTRPPAWVQAWRPPDGAYGPCPEDGSHMDLILDESGSVQGSDPIRYRHALMQRVLQTLAPACTCGKCTLRLVMFGATPATVSSPTQTTTWTQAPKTLAERFASMPWTGSYLGPAMDQTQETIPSPCTITICLTDLELFDPNPAHDIARFTNRPNPLLILLGPGNPPNLPNTPTVRVDDTSPRTEIADQIATHIINTRPQPPQNSTTTQKRSRRGRAHPTHRAAGLIAAGITGIALIMLLPWPLPHNKDQSQPATRSDHTTTNQQGTNHQGTAQVEPGSFTIPGLGGNAPRTTPMAAALYIDPSLQTDPGALTRIQNELPAVLDYLHNYRYPGDTLTLAATPPTPLTNLNALKTAGQNIQPAPPPRAAHSAGGADRMVAIITDRPTHWQTKFKTRTTKEARTPTKHPVRYYTIDITATQPIPTDLPNTGPWTIPASQQLGTVAQAIARAWGHAIGSHWLG